MPVVKWIQENERVTVGLDKTKSMSRWKNWQQARTGRPNDIAIVKSALIQIKACLDNAATSNTTNLYLTNSTSSNQAVFANGIDRLKLHVGDYISDNGNTRLFVAFEDITALASSPPTGRRELNFNDTKQGMNTIIIHSPFTTSFRVGGVTKSLSTWGRYVTVLHELTHSLMRTKDVWIKNLAYGIDPPDADNAVSTDDECRALANVASSNPINNTYGPHISWYNAENWARAIASCHPQTSTDPMYAE